jgi:tripartite-type tricarboxylate transporter receptor subunit TctC
MGKAKRTEGGSRLRWRFPGFWGCPKSPRRSMPVTFAVVVTFLLLGAIPGQLHAQTYPNKPIRLIIPFPPGGGSDILGRIIGQKYSEQLGQPIVPESRSGGAGNIGIEAAARSKPDGYTMVLSSPTISISPTLFKQINYDPVKDLAPISKVAQTHIVVVVRNGLPVKSIKEFIAHAKANPGKLLFGSGGVGTSTHLANELFKSIAKIDIRHVAYKGANAALVAMMSNEIDMVFIVMPNVRPHILDGRVRALAVLSPERVPALPDVPTIREAGIDNADVESWYGLFTTAGTPREIVNRLNEEWKKIAAMPDTKEKMTAAGVEPIWTSQEQLGEFLKKEIVRWGKVVKEANLSVD